FPWSTGLRPAHSPPLGALAMNPSTAISSRIRLASWTELEPVEQELETPLHPCPGFWSRMKLPFLGKRLDSERSRGVVTVPRSEPDLNPHGRELGKSATPDCA